MADIKVPFEMFDINSISKVNLSFTEKIQTFFVDKANDFDKYIFDGIFERHVELH
jgi:ribosome-associated translation inhibitor RaiA